MLKCNGNNKLVGCLWLEPKWLLTDDTIAFVGMVWPATSCNEIARDPSARNTFLFIDAAQTWRNITETTETVCNRLCSTIALQQALQTYMPPASKSRNNHGRDWQRFRCEQHVRVNKTGNITTQLTLHQALKPQHFKISDSNRQALKRHPVATKHSVSGRQAGIGWTI